MTGSQVFFGRATTLERNVLSGRRLALERAVRSGWRAVLARGVAVCALLCSVERLARASGGAATDAYEDIDEDEQLDVHALADVYLQHNWSAPSLRSVQFRLFDVSADVLALNLLRASLAHSPDPLGFRLDVGVGDTPDAYLVEDPAATAYPTLSRWVSYVTQAFLTWKVPLGSGISIDLGKFGAPQGYETNETPQNWNYSRSFLVLFAEPTVQSGLRATYAFSDELAVSAFWVNGWNTNVLAGNGMRSFAVAVSWNVLESLKLALAYAEGLERAPTDLSNPTLAYRREWSALIEYGANRRLGFAAAADYGLDNSSGGVSWWGVSLYARCRLLSWLSAVLRAEHYADADGFTTGTKQELKEATATLLAEVKPGPVSVAGRLEYRRDESNALVFRGEGARMLAHQDTATLGLTVQY
jgi:hypothetical protein